MLTRKILLNIRAQSRSLHSSSEWVSLHGVNGSPYTKKVQAGLRYKQIPFTYHQLMPNNFNGDWEERGFGHIKPKVIPVVRYSDGSSANDSTFIFEQLDLQYQDRPILPRDPVKRFLTLLLEDMFDEWGTKVMFGMRWQKEVDQEWSGSYLLSDLALGTGQPLHQVKEMGNSFASRQVSRMGLVGCKDPEIISRSFHQLTGALERHTQTGAFFLLGETPTAADFAFYGQWSQLVIDRTPDEILRTEYPTSWAWLKKFEDLSGAEPCPADSSQYIQDLLQFASDVYLPFLAANSKAIEEKEKSVEVILWEGSAPLLHSQPAFKYQQKCYQRIRQAFRDLPPEAGDQVIDMMSQTSCLRYLSDQ